MRHRVSGTKFNVSKDHRKMLLRNLVTSLVIEGRMVTTEAKAKAVKSAYDKFVTRTKDSSVTAKRFAKGYLTSNNAVEIFFSQRLPAAAGRTSGFTTSKRLITPRVGDGGSQVEVSLL